MNLYDTVFNYPTESEWGFTSEEIDKLLTAYPNINVDKFNDVMMGNTCMVIDGKIRNYHCDVAKAVVCGVENRKQTVAEWD